MMERKVPRNVLLPPINDPFSKKLVKFNSSKSDQTKQQQIINNSQQNSHNQLVLNANEGELNRSDSDEEQYSYISKQQEENKYEHQSEQNQLNNSDMRRLEQDSINLRAYSANRQNQQNLLDDVENSLQRNYSPFEVMYQRNMMVQDRLSRQPVFQWENVPVKNENNAFDYQSVNDPYETNKLRIFTVTWNIHGKLASQQKIEQLLVFPLIKHDIYIISTQECQKTIATSIISPNKDQWENRV